MSPPSMTKPLLRFAQQRSTAPLAVAPGQMLVWYEIRGQKAVAAIPHWGSGKVQSGMYLKSTGSHKYRRSTLFKCTYLLPGTCYQKYLPCTGGMYLAGRHMRLSGTCPVPAGNYLPVVPPRKVLKVPQLRQFSANLED